MAFESLKNLPKEQPEFPTAPKFSTLQYRYETFVDKLENELITNDQLKMDIINNYTDYCNYDNFHDHRNRKLFQKIWTNKKFLNGFLNALPIIQNNIINNLYYRTSICKMVYDYYYEIGINNSDDEIFKLMQKIANYINRREILILSAFMHEISASFIMIANYSSFKLSTNITRVNNFIIKLGYDFSVQNIIDIYSQLYREVFGTLFDITMTTNVSTDKFEEHQKLIWNRQNTAILTILESMPTYEIHNVLNGYRSFRKFYSRDYNNTINERFDIYNISQKDFPRVYNILKGD